MLHPITSKVRQGFTLLEMSIALIIIALVIGGIVLGNSLIESSRIRAVITQIEQYNTAVNTFKVKFNQLPGDLPPRIALQLNLASRSGSPGHGDANGLVHPDFGYTWTVPIWRYHVNAETAMFWSDLSTAGMLSGGFQGVDCNSGNSFVLGLPLCVSGDPTKFVPAAKIGKYNVIIVQGEATTQKNYFLLAGPANSINTGGVLMGTYQSYAISPMQALSIDTKIDDGLPFTGRVNAMANDGVAYNTNPAPMATAAAAAKGVCVTNATGNPYNVSGTSTGSEYAGACMLRFQFQ